MEHLLILTTIERIGDSLPFSLSQRRKGGKLKEYIQTLNEVCLLPNVELHKILQPLIDLYNRIITLTPEQQQKIEKDKVRAMQDIAKSKLVIMQLFSEYLGYSVDRNSELQLPNHFFDHFFYESNEDDKIISEEQQEQEEDEDDEPVNNEESAEENSEPSLSRQGSMYQGSGSGGSGGSNSDILSSMAMATSPPNSSPSISPTPSSPVLSALSPHSRTKSFAQRLRQYSLRKTAAAVKRVDETVAKLLLDIVKKVLFTKVSTLSPLEQAYEDHCKQISRQIIFKISISNPTLILMSVERSLTEVEPFVDLRILEAIHPTQQVLGQILKLFVQHFKNFMKNGVTAAGEVPHALRYAIWTWIENHPEDFLALHSTKQSVTGALELFEILRTNVKKKESKTAMWPLMTVLMLLNPEKFKVAFKAGAGSKTADSYCTFVHKHLMLTLGGKNKEKALIAPALVCLIDIYKAATYVPKHQESAAQMIAMLSEQKLHESYFGEGGSLPKLADGFTDIAQAALLVKTAFLYDQEKATRVLFKSCVEGSMEHKVVLCRALTSLAADRLPNALSPKISTIYDKLADTLRTMLQDLVDMFSKPQQVEEQEATPTPKKSSGISLLRRAQSEEKVPVKNYLADALESTVRMFAWDPNLYLSRSNVDKEKKVEQYFQCLTTAFIDVDHPLVQNQCGRLFRKLFLPKFIAQWSDNHKSERLIQLFISLSSTTLNRLSNAILDHSELQGFYIKQILTLIRSITYRCKRFYRAQPREFLSTEIINDKKRLTSLELISSNLLVCLCSSERDVWSISTRCLKDICDQIELLHNQELKYLNYNFYRQLSSVDLSGDMNNERRAQIKHFKKVEVQTKSNLAAFNEMYRRWKEIAKSPSADMDQFSSFTSLLCALGGVVLQQSQKQNKTTKKRTEEDEEQAKLDDFINDLMTQVISPNTLVRQMVTYSIASNLAPALYDKLFFHMDERVKTNFGDLGQVKVSASANLLVDQCIYITKTIVDSGEATYDLALASGLDTLLQDLATYCSRTAIDIEGIQMKCKYCYLLEAVMNKSEYVNFSNESVFRSKLLGQVLEWTTAVSGTEASSSVVSSLHDLDFVCMRAISALLNKHVIKSEKQEEFFKYLTVLEGYLTKTKEKSNLRNFVHSALQHLLYSNVSIGLQLYMQKVYSQDDSIRGIFLSLLNGLMKKGLKQLNEGETEEAAEEVDKYEELTKLIEGYDLKVVFTLLEAVKNNDKDEICDAVLNLFHNTGEEVTMKLLHESIIREVNNTIQAETLFRANSSASKLMKKYCLRVSVPYLKQCIGGLIERICKNAKDFEVDPVKAKQRNEDVAKNQKVVLQTLQEFLDVILASVSYMPTSFKQYCKFLFEEVGLKFSEKSTEEGDEQFEFKYIAVGGFLFLRLICPAITSPQLYGLYPDLPSNDARRFCIIITKVLQNLANGIVNNKKEEFMAFSEEWVSKNIPVIKNFFEDLAKPTEQYVGVTDKVNEEELLDSRKAVHRYLYNYQEAIRPALQQFTTVMQQEKKKSKEEAASSSTEEPKKIEVNAYDQLAALLESLGKPPEEDKKKKGAKKVEDEFSSVVLTDFLDKMGNVKGAEQQLQEIEKKDVFYQKGQNKQGMPVFYFLPNNFENTDMVIYHILKKMEAHWKQPYALLVDCSNWEEKHDIPFQAFNKLHRLLPKGVKKNLKAVYVFNTNSMFKNATRKLAPIMKKAHQAIFSFYVGTDELTQVIAKEQQFFVEDSLKSEREVIAIFSEIMRVTNDHRTKETIFRLCPKTLYVITKNEKIFASEVARIDSIPLGAIVDISVKKIAIGRAKGDFQIKYVSSEGEKVHTFRSEKKEQILQSVKTGINRVKSEMSAQKLSATRPLRPQDVPGQLLNIAFLNLESNTATTRYAAYQLLTNVARQFNLPDTKIIESDIISIPRNTEDLVCHFSERLAQTRPNLTLDFLLEALKGFEQVPAKAQIMCAKYIKFWIPNITQYLTAESKEESETQKLKEFFEAFTRISCKFTQSFPALTDMWKMMANDLTLTNYCIDNVIAMGLQKGPYDTEQFPLFCDLIVTLASKAREFVSKKIVSGLLDVVLNECDLPLGAALPEATTKKLVTLAKYLLALSFQNQVNISENLPEIFTIIILLAGVGNAMLRATIHAICCNVVHSLCTELPEQEAEARQSAIQLAAKLKTPEFVTIFNGNKERLDPFSAQLEESTNITPTTMYHIEKLAITLFDILTLYPGLQTHEWIEKWSSLLQKILKTTKVSLTPRVICTFCTIAPSKMCAEMVDYILGYLGKVGPSAFEVTDASIAVMLATVHLCNKLKMYTAENVKLAHKLFILGMFILPVATESLFTACVGMLLCVLNILYEVNDLANYQNFGHFFTSICTIEGYEAILEKFEKLAGLSFKEHFSFAASVLLMRGLVAPSTRAITLSLLKQFLIVSNKLQFLTQHSVGFIAALIPFEKQYHSTVYCEHLFQKEIFEHPKKETVFLFQKFMFAIVLEVQEPEKLAIYTTLMRGFETLPETFADVFKDHKAMSHVVKVYSHGTSDTLIECALSLFKSMSRGNTKNAVLTTKEPFEEIGFRSFNDYPTFKGTKVKADVVNLVISYLDSSFKIPESESLQNEKKETPKPQQVVSASGKAEK